MNKSASTTTQTGSAGISTAGVREAPSTSSGAGTSSMQVTASRAKSLWDQMLNDDGDDQDTFFHHSQTSHFWLSGQANIIA